MAKRETVEAEPPICFSRNDMSISARKARKVSARARAKSKTGAKARVDKLGPTPERLAKGDVEQGKTGQYLVVDALDRMHEGRTPPPVNAEQILSRLHKRVALDSDPGMSDRMFEAGRKYERVVHAAGMSGVAAQNLLSCGGGSGDPASSMPATEAAHRQRESLRKAWAIMGTKTATAVHAMLVEGRDAASVGRQVSSFAFPTECRAAATTTLRIGLSLLVESRWA